MKEHALTPETISQVQQLAPTKWWEIETLPQISEAVARVFGNQVNAFRECQTGNAEVHGNLLIIDASKPHLAPELGTVFTIDLKTGNAAGALYRQTGTTVYIGDYPDRSSLPHEIEDVLRGEGYAPQPFQYASSRSEATDTQAAKPARPEAAAAAALIEKSSQFSICRIQELEFARDPTVDKRTCCTDSVDLKFPE